MGRAGSDDQNALAWMDRQWQLKTIPITSSIDGAKGNAPIHHQDKQGLRL